MNVACIATVAAVISACSTPQPKAVVSKQKSKEYFSEKEYGVKASPRVSMKRSSLRRGGGRNQVGKPYKVKGKWYYPKEVRSYSKVGKASWYGSAFHGRLTANGEIYDMTHLTAAHPTLPLPSYARVTNLKNGNSVIVRINDRGPFAHGRVIDLSKRAAELLDYTHTGIATVKVDYVGRAPLHGRDDSYLIASYRPAGRAPDPSDGLASGVMIALNGSTPDSGDRRPPAFVGSATALPDAGPIIPDRPSGSRVAALADGHFDALAYAGRDTGAAETALAQLVADSAMAPRDVVGSWKRQQPTYKSGRDAVFAGTYSNPAEAEMIANRLSAGRKIELETTHGTEATWISITVWPQADETLNQLIRSAWASGATDAMILKN